MQRILAIDYGTKRIGFAITDEDATFALKLPVKLVSDDFNLVEYTINKINESQITLVIIGYPLNSKLERTALCKNIDIFIEGLNERMPELKIVKVNEALTSNEAKKGFKEVHHKSRYIDNEAARIMLQEYLDQLKATN